MTTLLTLALAAPLVDSAHVGVRAAEESGSTSAAFWKVLRPSDNEAEEDHVLRWTEEDLHDVHFVEPEIGYAVGANGAVLRTTDAGESWKVWRLRGVGDLHGVHFVDDQVGHAVGDEGVILRTTDGGESWLRVRSGVDVSLRDVQFPTPDVGYVVGDTAGDEYTVLRTERSEVPLEGEPAGASWEQVEVASGGFGPGPLQSVHFVDEDNGVAVGGDTQRIRIVRTANGGEDWTETSSRNDTGRPMRSVVLLAGGGLGYAVGAQGIGLNETFTVLRTTDAFSSQERERSVRDLHGLTSYSAGETGDPLVHAVGSESGVPVILTRSIPESEGAWIAEPIEDWARHGGALRAVSASPGGDTVVAVGEGGTMLRRSTDPEELPPDPDALCVPPELVEPLDEADARPDDFPVCGSPDDPEEQDPQDPGDPGDPTPTPTPTPTPAPTPTPPPANPPDDRPCEVEINDEFPCLRQFRLADETGNAVNAQPRALFFAPNLGSGRVVAVQGRRVFLYDSERLDQRGVPGFGKHFGGLSAAGETTGVVNLEDAEEGASFPEVQESGRLTVLDAEHQRLYVASPLDALEVGGSIGVISLIGEFPPRVFQFDSLGVGSNTEPAWAFTHLAVDGLRSMLYVVTANRDAGVNQLVLSAGATHGVTVHAFEARLGEGDDAKMSLALEHRWSDPVEQWCPSSRAPTPLQFFGVSDDGRRLALGCHGTDFSATGEGQVQQNGIFTLTLPQGRDPRALTDQDRVEFRRNLVAVPGGGIGLQGLPNRAMGDVSAEVMVWRTGGVVLVWDVARSMWIGSTTVRRGTRAGGRPRLAHLLAADPSSGRLYLAGGEAGGGNLTLYQIANLPGSVERGAGDAVPTGVAEFSDGSSGEGVQAAFDPRTRRLVAAADIEGAGSRLVVLEDRIPPPVAFEDPDPDARTHDIDEREAFSVDRRGEVAAYGARLWWTGLRGAIPGSYGFNGDDDGSILGGLPTITTDGEPPPGLTYDHLFRGPWGMHTTRLPWRPHESKRELFSARVEDASLSNLLSRAAASGLDIDGETGEDARSRRGAGEWRDALAVTAETFCDNIRHVPTRDECREQWPDQWREGYEQFQDSELGEGAARLEDCTLEAHDRLMRELDGDRRIHHVDEDGEPDPCFGPFDAGDPDSNEETGENERPGVEQRLGWTQSSQCADPGETAVASTGGSSVVCDRDAWSTEAGAESGFSVEFPGGVALRVDSTRSAASVVRDEDDEEKGIVPEAVRSEAVAVASGIELAAEGGVLRIGEVRTEARAWAAGRPGTAASEYEVTYHDVTLTGPAGKVVFSCEPGADCDPHELGAAVEQVFFGRVEMKTPARDLDPRVTGTPGGAQSIVRRDRPDYWEDRVLFDLDRNHLAGLQLTIVADGTLFNRYRVDLAAVFAEARYFIGERASDVGGLPAGLEVQLTDGAGAPLGGGEFEVVADSDGDGTVSAGDSAVARCTTGSDGVGDCRLSSLVPGTYLVRQLAAPPGYLPQETPARVDAIPGSVSTATFVNHLNAGTVEITLVDPGGEPLEGGLFELTHEGGDVRSCDTDAGGRCEISPLPLGGYTLAQPEAPSGYEPTEPVEFALSEPGQVAEITVVNGLLGSEDSTTVVEIIEVLDGTEAEPAVSRSGGEGGGWLRRAAAGLFSMVRGPAQAIAFALLAVLVATPVYLAVRRRELSMMRELT